MSDSKKADRDQTAHQLNIPADDAQILDQTGRDSASRRKQSFEPPQVKFPSPGEETIMDNAGKESAGKREHVTSSIAREYQGGSS
ncbi:hypothetical protein N7447_004381 [Penicillium robsamsonii]|uniref:uncharacterized protein n=1 Tax=Penicillium robsamsonii TaxID=1792511 RepID=UPI0025485073|nr:uncharacterized protein N7447_004381 [Penicillium robsamsonii]KAJ5507032.1 hypothetical protein N7527_009175 [Penicillium freii]KAJ5704466.1 hypothetical protein N7536_000155 [Penicillium majusculum]KAJ5827618.1 hypothetical protein N7447_004381 [Penicillium robsamsonii]